MMNEEPAHHTVLLEDIRRRLQVIAEAVVSQTKRLVEMEDRLMRRFDVLDAMLIEISLGLREIKTKLAKIVNSKPGSTN